MIKILVQKNGFIFDTSAIVKLIKSKKSSKSIIANGYDADLVAKVLKMVNRAEFKRYQTPPTLRVSPKAFGMGRRMPIVGKYLS